MNASPGPTQLSIIVLTYNQCAQTLRCLEQLIAMESEEGPFHILLWDNGSADGTADAVRSAFPTVAVHACVENLGVAKGRNAAASLAIERFDPEFLLFLDNDIVVRSGFIAGLRSSFTGPGSERVGQVQAKLLLADDPERLNDGGGCRVRFWLAQTRPVGYGEPDSGQYDEPTQCVACGGAMMVRTQVFRQLQGFDEDFTPFGPEDIDFSLRLQSSGWEAWYNPRAVGVHDVNHTFGAGGYSEDYAAHRARHWMRLMRRHASLGDWLGFVLIGIPLVGLRVLWREGRKRNLSALRGLFRGAFADTDRKID